MVKYYRDEGTVSMRYSGSFYQVDFFYIKFFFLINSKQIFYIKKKHI